MDNMKLVMEAVWEKAYKAAVVNVITGEYEFAKELPEEREAGCLNAKRIEDYAQCLVNHNFAHEQDKKQYLSLMRADYLREKVCTQNISRVYSYRRREGEQYVWVTIEIIVPSKYSPEDPWVVLLWRKADTDTTAMEDNLKMMSTIYHKVLKINLTTDSHEELKVYDAEMDIKYGLSPRISEWFRSFALSGNVYEIDLEKYLEFTEIQGLRRRFHEDKKEASLIYRRLVDGEYRWVSMEMIPSVEYAEDNQVVMLYIRDIHDEYMSRLRMQRELEYWRGKNNQ
ncbi:MAG: hypothetical protein PUF45_04620 [Lachnospiraceae bacterium]|nr:hypothetical protein [Lachnospiraceae bacterium]